MSMGEKNKKEVLGIFKTIRGCINKNFISKMAI